MRPVTTGARARRFATLALSAWLGLAPAARAQEGAVDTRPIAVRWQHGVPQVSVSAADMMDPAVSRKLKSGLPQTLVMRVYAYPTKGKKPIAVTARSCRVVFDLWDNVYRVQVQTDARDTAFKLPDLQAVARRCLVADQLAVGTAENYAQHSGQSVYFAALVEFNPMSPDTVQRIRRWLARPGGGQLAAEAFFGSFVSIFVNRRIGAADKVLGFRCPAERVPP